MLQRTLLLGSLSLGLLLSGVATAHGNSWQTYDSYSYSQHSYEHVQPSPAKRVRKHRITQVQPYVQPIYHPQDQWYGQYAYPNYNYSYNQQTYPYSYGYTPYTQQYRPNQTYAEYLYYNNNPYATNYYPDPDYSYTRAPYHQYPSYYLTEEEYYRIYHPNYLHSDQYNYRSSVSIQNFSYSPRVIYVRRGTTVKWTNDDTVPHTVNSDDGSFKSGTLQRGQTFSYRFMNNGTYHYACLFHPDMRATIVVTD